MLPLPMTEYGQENLNAVGFDAEFEVMEWNALGTFGCQPVTGQRRWTGRRAAGARAPESASEKEVRSLSTKRSTG